MQYSTSVQKETPELWPILEAIFQRQKNTNLTLQKNPQNSDK